MSAILSCLDIWTSNWNDMTTKLFLIFWIFFLWLLLKGRACGKFVLPAILPFLDIWRWNWKIWQKHIFLIFWNLCLWLFFKGRPCRTFLAKNAICLPFRRFWTCRRQTEKKMIRPQNRTFCKVFAGPLHQGRPSRNIFGQKRKTGVISPVLDIHTWNLKPFHNNNNPMFWHIFWTVNLRDVPLGKVLGFVVTNVKDVSNRDVPRHLFWHFHTHTHTHTHTPLILEGKINGT